ncbi:MAG TPA: hypothetical protein VM489_05325, partial [Burkholderiales bacterium]|nr:hypothetical protein [Burkholderiales bacterium]
MLRLVALALALAALLACGPLAAQEYTGRYIAAAGTATLALVEHEPAAVRGTLQEQGVAYALEGAITIEGLFATLKAGSRVLYM